MTSSACGLSIMVWSCDRKNPERAATPFLAAQAGAALDLQVEMLFTAQAVQWLFAEHSGELIGFGAERLAVRDYLQATHDAGVEILACSQALHALGRGIDALAPQCAGSGGMVAFLERGQRPGWRTLVF